MQDLSSWTRDQTHILCIKRWILNHWTTKESLTWKLYTISEIPFRILSFRKQQFERWGEDVKISIGEERRRKGRWEQTREKKEIRTKEIARHSNIKTLTEVEIEEAEMHEKGENEKENKVGKPGVPISWHSAPDYWVVQALLLPSQNQKTDVHTVVTSILWLQK